MRLRALSGILVTFLFRSNSIEAQSAIAFTNVAVVDVEKGVLRLDQTVVIEGSRIIAADDAQRIRLPRGTLVINGKSKSFIFTPAAWYAFRAASSCEGLSLTRCSPCGVHRSRVMYVGIGASA